MRIGKIYCGHCARYCLSRNSKHVLFFSLCATGIWTEKHFWNFIRFVLFCFVFHFLFTPARLLRCGRVLVFVWGISVGLQQFSIILRTLVRNCGSLRYYGQRYRIVFGESLWPSLRFCLFGLISSLFTLLMKGQKLALIMLFAADDSFNCSCHKNVRKENFAANYFQLDKVENLALPRC